MAAWLVSSSAAMCVDTCRFAMLYYKTHCNGCVHFAWGWFWGGSRSTKPCVFRVKWLQPEINGSACAAGAAGVVLTFFLCLSVTVASSCFECVCVCARVVLGWLGICCCISQWNGCMIDVIFCCRAHRYVKACCVSTRSLCSKSLLCVKACCVKKLDLRQSLMCFGKCGVQAF